MQVCEYSDQTLVWQKGELKEELKCGTARVVSQAQFQIGAAPQKADNRNKIGAASREVPQKAENRSYIKGRSG